MFDIAAESALVMQKPLFLACVNTRICIKNLPKHLKEV